MSTNTIELPWGAGKLAVPLPSTWRVLGQLPPKQIDAPADPRAACAAALADPIEAAPLASRDLSKARVVVVTDDHSRPTPVRGFLPAVLDQLTAAGAEQERIEILLANGVHRASTPQEVAEKLGPEPASRLRWRCHNASAPAELAELGSTPRGTRVLLNRTLCEADLIVCVGAIEPHLLLGFGGGLKMLVPGCAGTETIGKNHMQGVDPDHFDFVGADAEHSPMRQDLEQAARLLRKEIFIVNAVMNAEGRPVRFFCGDPVAAHRAGVAFIRDLVELRVSRQADVVLTNSHPMDSDLRQSAKCLGNSLYACRPGGVMMGCVYCEHGLGEMPIPKRTLPYPLLRTLLQVIGKHRVLPLVERIKRGEPVEEIFVGHFGLQMLRRNHLALYSEKLPADTGRKMGLARTYNDLAQMVRWVAARVPRHATVWVFPYGGATYATL
jgi:nickel-dependent lactate racemase